MTTLIIGCSDPVDPVLPLWFIYYVNPFRVELSIAYNPRWHRIDRHMAHLYVSTSYKETELEVIN